MEAALISVGGVLVLAIVGAAWHLGSRMARVEGKLDGLPTHEQVEQKIQYHEQHCPAFRAETTGGPALPTVRADPTSH